MGKINVLSFEIANLIAAGEVVDRPASVLKELLENAIDAGSKHIVCEIANGGIRLIRVKDDGCGMSKEDMPISLRRHATSKIKDAKDLNEIATLGFRGEALAAISSVSTITILSKQKEDDMGTMLQAKGGTIEDLSEIGCADGTTVIVENLFENVPARRKFLKKDSTEATACQALVEKVVLSHPEIAFQFVSDGRVKFSTAGDGKIKSVLYAIYGKEYASRILEINSNLNGILVSGFVGCPDNSHGNRNMQNTFINGRYVKSKTVQAALERAFTSYMAPEKYPVSNLYLDLAPDQVDVNVHPAKLEVRFTDERAVFEAIYWAVRGALEKDTSRPELTLTKDKTKELQAISGFVPLGKETIKQEKMELPPSLPKMMTPQKATPEENKEKASIDDSLAFLRALDSLGKEKESPVVLSNEIKKEPTPMQKVETVKEPEEVKVQIPSYRILGVAFKTYVYLELEDYLLVFDQHAAHERILFEELLAKQKKEGAVPTQGLLIPIQCDLTTEETDAALGAKDEFALCGFDFVPRQTGNGVSILSIPSHLSTVTAKDLFQEMAGELKDSLGNPEITNAKRRERQLYQVACKGAIKGGREYTDEQIKWLSEKVLSMPDVTCCPHGRPIAYKITKRELDRNFDRIK